MAVTATNAVRKDIMKFLHFQPNDTDIIALILDRPNIFIDPSLDRFSGPFLNLFLTEEEFAISFEGVVGAKVYPPPNGSSHNDKCIGLFHNIY